MSPPFLHIQIYKFLERPAFHPTGRIFYKGRKLRKQGILVLRSSFLSAFLEKDGPQDGKRSAYVKKSVLFERSEFHGF
jgi:hypothetical protein